MHENLVKKIRQLCKEEGISVRRLERDNNFGNGLVAKWTRSSPNIEYLQRVAEYFNVTVDYLMESSDEKYAFPHNIIVESRTSQRIDKETYNENRKNVDINALIKHLLVLINDESRVITYNNRTLTSDELPLLKDILEKTSQEFIKLKFNREDSTE